MKQKKILEIVSAGNLVLDASQRDLRENYVESSIGTRNEGSAGLIEKDFGTKSLFASAPVRPNAFFTITNITDSSGALFTTGSAHGFSVGEEIVIDETTIDGRRFNGTWIVSATPLSTTFRVTGSPAVITSGATTGICSTTPIVIHRAFIFRDKSTNTEYPVVIGIDSSSNTRIYVYDTASATLDSSYNGSYWIELSRFFTAAINEGAGIGASDTNFDFDTLAENGVTYTGAADFVNNWIVVNTTQSNETVFITDSTASNLTVDTIVGSNGLGWANNDVIQIYRMPCFKYNWTASNGATPHIDFHFVEDQRKLNILYGDSSTPTTARQSIQLMRRDARNYFYTAYAGSAQRTLPAGWYCESDYGILNPYMATEGTIQTPITTFANITDYVIDGTTNASPIQVTTSVAHGRTTGDKIAIWGCTHLAANGYWTITTAGGTTLTLDNSVGTTTSSTNDGGWISVAETSVYDKTSGRNWMSVLTGKLAASVGGSTANNNLRMYITITYNGYQESDPIFQGFYQASSSYNWAALYQFVIANFSLMNKEITAINIYWSSANSTIYSAGWNDSSSEYYLFLSIPIQIESVNPATGALTKVSLSRLQVNPVNNKPYFATQYLLADNTSANLQFAIDSGASTIQSVLNHEVDKNRNYPTPLYAAKFGSEDGETMSIYNSDGKIFIANHNGSGTLEDDNFPDVRTDASGNRLKITPSGTGEIFGFEILDGIIHVLRSNQCEQYDLQGVFVRSFKIDCVSKMSVHVTPYGIVFAGKSGIYLIPIGGGGLVSINQDWEDFYNGSQYVTGTTPYITDTYRSAIVGGFDELLQESWLNIKSNTESSTEIIQYRYKHQTGQWRERQLNTSEIIKNFANSFNNKVFYIVTGSLIYLYPNNEGTLPFEDVVRVNGAGTEVSQSKSVLLDCTINIAEFDNEAQEKILDEFRLNFEGSSTNTYGTFAVEFYANDEEVAFDTHTVRIDEIMDWRGVERRGEIKRLRIRFYTADDVNLQGLNVKKSLLKYLD